MKSTKRSTHLVRAIKQAGGPAALARHLNRHRPITSQAISQWRRCPGDRVIHVVNAPGVTVNCIQLRPDIYKGIKQ